MPTPFRTKQPCASCPRDRRGFCDECHNLREVWEYPNGTRHRLNWTTKVATILDLTCAQPLSSAKVIAHLANTSPNMVYVAWFEHGIKKRPRNFSGNRVIRVSLPRQVADWLDGEGKRMGDNVTLTLAARSILVDAYHEAMEGDEKEYLPSISSTVSSTSP